MQPGRGGINRRRLLGCDRPRGARRRAYIEFLDRIQLSRANHGARAAAGCSLGGEINRRPQPRRLLVADDEVSVGRKAGRDPLQQFVRDLNDGVD
jgi:hypothetical protein